MSTTYISSTHASWQPPSSGAEPARPRRRPGRTEFRRDIEGLRAVAVLLVVGYHAGIGAVGGGYIGVDVFFVISGFLITGNLFNELERTGRISFLRFYGRRMIRLLPASTVVVLGTLAAAWHWMPPLSIKAVSTDALAAATYAMNYRLAIQNTDYLGAQRDPSPLQHFWSLAVEEQFYLLWPVLLVLASLVWTRRRPNVRAAAAVLACLSAASLYLCITQTTSNLPWAYFGLHTRAWELGVGALVALGARRIGALPGTVAGPLGLIGLGAVLFSAVTYTDSTVFPGYAALLPVFGAALIIAAGCAEPRWGAGQVLGVPPMQELGRLSYSWYLWHWPVIVIAPHVLGHRPSTLTMVALAAVTLVPASISLAAVENRIRFHRVFRRPRGALPFGFGLTAVAAALTLLSIQLPPPAVIGTTNAADTADALATPGATPARLTGLIESSTRTSSLARNLNPPLIRVPVDRPQDGNCNAPLNVDSITYNILKGCERKGFTSGTEVVVLFGDSHAEQWYDALNVIAQRRRWRIAVFVKGGCTPASALIYKGETKLPYTECQRWREGAFTRMSLLKPARVVMSSLSYGPGPLDVTGYTNAAWVTTWTKTLRRIQAMGATPVIIQDTPLPGQNVPECLSAHPRQISRCNLSVRTTLDASRRRALQQMAKSIGVDIIDPVPWMCTRTICPAVIGNTAVYRDDSHITATYAKILGPVLSAELK